MILCLYNNGITAEGYSSFSKVLGYARNIPANVASLLALNRRFGDKKLIAMKKILTHHEHFDMQPFFEWDLKVLPVAVDWFERARAISVVAGDKAGVKKQKLGAIYQFIRAMPEVFSNGLLLCTVVVGDNDGEVVVISLTVLSREGPFGLCEWWGW